ncbi:MAG: hypothetical protein A3F67_09060 [Verrucomicrobia bacterium RIFCSPHIGHO2_12_FULL_41_10]|nr:MAG: hypothetical protein A3F67_09060 [Verrucomicrobia bacterium RIFCSPHIGHO2_12_FULL_41_10]
MKKWLLRLFGLCAIVCAQTSFLSSSHTSELHEHNFGRLVQEVYPGAQFWFNAMIKKYPQAHLEQTKFCVSDEYASGVEEIYFPFYVLEMMHKVFKNAHLHGVTDEMFVQFAEDEYLLLHEAKHVLSKDIEHGDQAIAGSMVLSFGTSFLLAYKTLKEDINVSTAVAGSVASIAAAYVALCSYAQFQERRADDFANQNADARTLRAGACWFKRLDVLMNLESISVPEIFNTIAKIIQDPTHPLPLNRQNKALRALLIRFGQTA